MQGIMQGKKFKAIEFGRWKSVGGERVAKRRSAGESDSDGRSRQ